MQATIEPSTKTTAAAIAAYLRRTLQFAGFASLHQQESMILKVCESLNLAVSDAEIQAAGDEFRRKHQLLGATDTVAWLAQQQILIEDWAEGLRIELLTAKLKEHLFGGVIDSTYISDRQKFRRVALSQILLQDSLEVLKIKQQLGQDISQFCKIALEHSQASASRNNGGFLGIRFVTDLIPVIQEAVLSASEGDLLGPIQTELGYHLVKVEKIFPVVLDEPVRARLLDYLWQNWLQEALKQEKAQSLSQRRD
jgi:parvulin-like peptidyl-prolyl isomerase